MDSNLQVKQALAETSKTLRRNSAGSINRLFRPASDSSLDALYYPGLDKIDPNLVSQFENACYMSIRHINHLLEDEASVAVKDMLIERLKKRIETLKLINSAAKIQRNTNTNTQANRQLVKEFLAANKDLYKEPSTSQVRLMARAFYRTLAETPPAKFKKEKAELKKLLTSHGAELKKLPLARALVKKDQFMAKELINWAKKEYPRAMNIIQSVDRSRVYNAQEVQLLFKQIINNPQWRVLVSRRNLSVSVSVTSKTVHLPAGYMRDGRSTRILLAHEYFGHIRRALNAEHHDFAFLRTGLADYGQFEEPFASILGRVLGVGITKDIQPRGHDLYLAIALAKGYVTSRELNAPAVYEILWRYFTLRDHREIHRRDPKRHAHTLTLRVFRGTPGNLPGLVMTKDITYFENFNSVKEAIRAKHRAKKLPEWLDFVMLGKFDPLNKAHVHLVEEIIRK